jgi:hypothetical protein
MVSIPAKDPREIQKKLQLQKEQERQRAAAIEKQRQIWKALNEFIRRRGGHLTSTEHARPLIVQIPQFSELADELYNLGYDLTPAGSSTWIENGQFKPVQVFHFQIPMPR